MLYKNENSILPLKIKIGNNIVDKNIFDDTQINQVLRICKNKIKFIDYIN